MPYVFVLLNVTTLIGSSRMFLVPLVIGRNNFDEGGLLGETYLYESFGLNDGTYLGTITCILNLLLPCIYLV